MTVTYSVYGVGLRVNVPLAGLNGLAPAGRIDVSMHVGEIPADVGGAVPGDVFYETDDVDETGAPLARVSRVGRGAYYRIEYADGTRVIIDAAGDRIWAHGPSSSVEETATYLLGPVLGFVLRLRGVTCLHASAVAVGDRAVAFVGASGTGKSSIAAALAMRGHAVLSDDVTPLAEIAGELFAQPAYPRLRLWPESVGALFGSADAMPRIVQGWDKRHVDLTARPMRFQFEALPLAAIYLLDTGRGNPRVTAVAPRNALMALVAETYTTRLIDRKLRAREFELLGRLVERVPVRRLRRGENLGDLPLACELVMSGVQALALH